MHGIGDIMAEVGKASTGSSDRNSTDLGVRRNQVTDRLQKREEERLDDVKKRRDEKENASVASESTEFFLENFSRTKVDVESQLDSCGTVPKSELPAHFDAIGVLTQKLQKYLTDSTMFIPTFELQKAQQAINKLQSDAQVKRDQLIPKKKFAFKGKKTQKSDVAAAPVPETAKKEMNIAISECNFADVVDKTLVKNPEEVTNQDVALARLSNCTVKLYGSPGAVHISNLKDCKVFCGPVSGSVFIDQCTRCVFVMPCQQMRIHSTTSSDFYIHVTSKAIIEDCQQVRFAQYNWRYPAIDEHYDVSRLDKGRNNWNDVDDFNWLASDSHSPNWSELPEQQRIQHWDE